MAARDRLFAASDVVLIAGPLTATALQGARSAVARLAAAPGWGWISPGSRASRPDGAVVELEPDLDDAGLVAALRAVGLGGAIVRLAVSGDRLALLMNHASADGVESSALLAALLSVAVGQRAPTPARPVRFPLLVASRRVGVRGVRSYLRTRGAPAGGAPAEPARPGATEPGRARMTGVVLESADLAGIRNLPVSGGRASTSTRVISVLVAALRAVSADPFDPVVGVPLDLRHFAGGPVRGNFAIPHFHGGLRSADWSPASISARIARGRERSVVALDAAILRSFRVGARHRTPRYSVSVSVLPEPRIPLEAWSRPQDRTVRCATVDAAWPSATFVFVTVGADRVACSIWDETGRFDLDRVAVAVEAEVRARAAA